MKRNDYNNFNDNLQRYLGKAADIYYAINKTKLDLASGISIMADNREINSVLSLFMAGFFEDKELKELYDTYSEIKLEDFLKLTNLKFDDIKELTFEERRVIYDACLYSDIFFFNGNKDITNETTPFDVASIIIKSTNLLKIWGKYFHKSLLKDPLYDKLRDHNITEEVKTGVKENIDYYDKLLNYINTTSPIRRHLYNKDINTKIEIIPFFKDEQKEVENKESVKEKEEPKSDENLWKTLDDIRGKFIGQEDFCSELFYNIVNNQHLSAMDNISDGQRSIIFVDGPTGTGKTAITRDITEKLDIPFVHTSITNYSSTGYVGGNITDLLKDLYKKANNDIEKAQRGIIVLDEMDKITYKSSRGLEMKKAVQQQLLDFLGGGKYSISDSYGPFGFCPTEFDTSKLTFICLGALTDIRTDKVNTKQSIGFGKTKEEVKEYSIAPSDLIEMGLERELVGRFNTYLHTNDYDKESLLKILKESTISPLIQLVVWAKSYNKELTFDDEVYNIIVDKAYELNTGARSLQTVVNQIRSKLLEEVLRGKDEKIHLDKDRVSQIVGAMTSRKVRG